MPSTTPHSGVALGFITRDAQLLGEPEGAFDEDNRPVAAPAGLKVVCTR